MMRLVVLISGQGSNLQAIIDACILGQLKAQVVLVISNQATAYGLIRAHKHRISCQVVEVLTKQKRQDYDIALANKVAAAKPDCIVLAGFMRILSSEFIQRFPSKIINIHPALPGTFPGTKAIKRAFLAFSRQEISETGVMIHRVIDEGIDSGPVLAQKKVAIYSNDTIISLSKRIHDAEHRLIISVLQQLESGLCPMPYCLSTTKAD